MSFAQDHRLDAGYSAADAIPAERAAFIRRTYAHVAGAILAFIGLEAALLSIPGIENTVFGLLSTSRWSWLVVLLAFVGVSRLAAYWAQSQTSVGTQYLGLGLYVLAEAVIFLPLMIIAIKLGPQLGEPNIVPKAALITLGVFAGLTMTVFITKKDFSFLGPILSVCFWVALAMIVAGIIFGFSLGLFFVVAMIAVMAGCILYQTSAVLHQYPTDMHVAAALMLFASIALLFWYVLQLLLILASSRE
jgi:FtsH-binding integral membrane protein